jgi:GT2 family glycosyltransferase
MVTRDPGMSGELAVSIVVPTYNRRERLARLFGGLDIQSIEPEKFEVVIVDDGSTDGTSDWLGQQQRRYAVRAIRQSNGGPALARNAGIEAAASPLLLFLDDDVEPTARLVEEHVRSHEVEPDLAVMGPLGSLPGYNQPWVTWEQAKLESQYASMLRGDWAPTFRQFWTGNASVRKEHVVSVGAFDPAFLRAEDVELAYRLHTRGIRFRFNPAAIVLHHAERSLESWANMHRSYGRLEVAIFGKYSEDVLIRILAENWSRLHPAARWLVQGCAGKARRHAYVSFMLQSWLKLEAATRPILADKVCSAFASLLYWQASVEALGPDRSGAVFRRGDEIRRAPAT